MIIVRRYKNLGWFDLLDCLKEELDQAPPKEKYFDFLDEFRMRLIESVSEGASFKLKAPTKELLARFEARLSKEPEFASQEDLLEFQRITEDIL